VRRQDTTRSFVACESRDHPHARQFLIFRKCRRLGRMGDRRIARATADLGERHGFSLDYRKIEVTGVCSACRGDDSAPKAIQLPDPGRAAEAAQSGAGGSAVTSAAGVLATGAGLVVIGAGIAAVDAPVPLHALVHVNNADTVAARALQPLDGHAHGTTPVSALMSSSCSCGSVICSIMFVSISRTWQSGML